MADIVYIDDEEDILSLAKTYFDDRGHEIEVFSSVNDALVETQIFSKKIVISDLRMPSMDGKQLFDYLSKGGFKGHFILVSGNISDEEIHDCSNDYVHFIAKPLDFDLLIDKIQGILNSL